MSFLLAHIQNMIFNTKIKDSIATKILVVVFFFYFIVTLTLTVIHMYAEYNSTRNRVYNELILFENTFSPALAGALWGMNDELLNSTVEGMLKNPILKGVKIEDGKRSKILKEVINFEGLRKKENTLSDRQYVNKKEEFYEKYSYQFNITFNDDGKTIKIGVCTVYSSISVVLSEVKLGFYFIVINAFLKTIALWIIYLLVSRRMLSQPLFKLTEAVKEISLDNLDHFNLSIHTAGTNELKILQDAFHFMVNNLLKARNQLENNIRIAKRFSLEGRKISSCLTDLSLRHQISDSFNQIVGKDIHPQVTFINHKSVETSTALNQLIDSNKSEDRSDDFPRTSIEISDSKGNLKLGEISFFRFESADEEADILPLFNALSVNVANTLRNIDMMDELKQKAHDLEQSNAMLARMDKLKDEFLANTSHELKTPLNGMIGISETLVDGAAGALSKEQKRYISMIIHSGKSLSYLIGDLQDFSKISNNAIRLEITDVNLHHIVDIVLQFFVLQIKRKQLKLIKNIPDHLPLVKADENRLQQILFNLMTNAIKFTFYGQITVTLTKENQFLKVTVGDSGIGISKEKRELIFQPFQQTYDPVLKDFGGAGLGLSISKQLVELHGGELWVESVEGVGSAFTFSLPCSDNTIETPISDSKIQAIKSRVDNLNSSVDFEKEIVPVLTEKQRDELILVVDDDTLNLQIVRNHLLMSGFQVITAKDGAQALEMIAHDRPDLVLLDLMMPVLNGLETCLKIRQQYDLTTLPIIIVTAKNQVWDLVESLENGANDYIMKPFLKQELLARVETHLKAKKMVGQLKEVKRLETEIQKRNRIETDLQISQQRLLRILDVADSALVAMNQSLEALFFNQKAEELSGYAADQIVGQHIRSVITQKSLNTLTTSLSMMTKENRSNQFISIYLEIQRMDGKIKGVQGFIAKLVQQDDLIVTLIFNDHLEHQDAGLNEAFGFYSVPDTQDKLSRHHLKTQAFGEAIHEVSSILSHPKEEFVKDLRYFGTIFENITNSAIYGKKSDKIRKTLVLIMKGALKYWEQQNKKDKIALSEESKIWKVYLDSGTFRSRTLDRYLNIKTLPKHPKWKEVIKTALFVMENSPYNQVEKDKLIASIEELIHLFQNG